MINIYLVVISDNTSSSLATTLSTLNLYSITSILMQSAQHYKTKIQNSFSLFEYVVTLINQRYVLKISGKRKARLLLWTRYTYC